MISKIYKLNNKSLNKIRAAITEEINTTQTHRTHSNKVKRGS